VLDDDEECDAFELGGQTCESLGFVGGTLKCSGTCELDTSECTKCGNGSVEPQLGEECDFDAVGDPLVLTTCQGLGFGGSSANPGCDATCHYDTGPCLCGNGTVDGGESCDGADFDGKTCQTFGFAGGMLSCSPDCEILATGCNQNTCGNGVIDGAEACDGADLGGKTCVTRGFAGGTLSCSPACQLVTSGCTACGNGTLEAGEQCDDGNVASGDGCSATCQSEVLACDPDGAYTIVQGGPVSYSCCSGLVSVNVSSFVFQQDGATVLASPSNPAPLSGAATTCPSGGFSNTGSIPGGCTETYSLSGSFTGPNTWDGLFQISFTGPDCSCFGGLFGTPCIGQVYPITAMK
jgi:cysteine-rich repeat protein